MGTPTSGSLDVHWLRSAEESIRSFPSRFFLYSEVFKRLLEADVDFTGSRNFRSAIFIIVQLKMFTPEVTQSKNYDHFVPSIVPNKTNNGLVSSTFLSPTPSHYSDSGSYQQSPLSVYNNYNPNYHHHHYYFHANFPDYGYNQPMGASFHENGSNWMRKYDCENQKEYFIANTPPTDCYDFEVPQRISESPKPTTMKLFNDLEKIFSDDHNTVKAKDQLNNISSEPCDPYNFWDNEHSCSEKVSKKIIKAKEKLKCENVQLENNFNKSKRGIAQEGEKQGLN